MTEFFDFPFTLSLLDDFYYITQVELDELMYKCDRITCYGCRFRSLCVKYKQFKVIKY